ncbi:hypothetical protein E1B28_002154 [Marasmius oreades]|uniref:Cytochrome P450 n=1 Tax=Marasmius oreades TaxID=181124 RepID=A0A9P7UMT9_9AGAR|nr:uncharacterized protein E1B28_002154 [Marasmius oreades]KAG7086191.1 hypothetical protein E1B28_002154 [Marasmius oreades]
MSNYSIFNLRRPNHRWQAPGRPFLSSSAPHTNQHLTFNLSLTLGNNLKNAHKIMVQIALPFDLLNAAHPWTLTLLTVAICSILLARRLWFIRGKLHVRDIPGPVDNVSWLYGNLPELLLSRPYGKFELQWQEQYGSIYRFKGCFSEDLLFISDPAAIRSIFNSAKLFDFSPNRTFIAVLTSGVDALISLRIGGEVHRRIKNAFSPAFTPARLQPYVPVMRDISRKVPFTSDEVKAADKLMQKYLERDPSDLNAVVDIYRLLQHVTSDIIGEVGFGQQFNAVETNGGDKVVQSLQNVIMLGSRPSKNAILGESIIPYVPRIILRLMLHLPTRTVRTLQSFRELSEAWASALLMDSLHPSEDSTDGGLVGFVVSSNKNIKHHRLSFNEISRQTLLLLAAGQDTTANTLTWALYELARRPIWQDQLRKEIIEAENSEPSLDKLDYLNAHIKETLRFYPSVPLTERITFEDTILPLSRPITTISGRVITELPIRKGQMIHVGIASYNRDPHVWGPDAHTFNPLRWVDGRHDSGNLPESIGPYSNLATFVGGARMCLGWRLALLEMQVVLSELIPKFRFSFGPGQEDNVTSSFAITLLPLDVGSEKPSLKLLIQPTQAYES